MAKTAKTAKFDKNEKRSAEGTSWAGKAGHGLFDQTACRHTLLTSSASSSSASASASASPSPSRSPSPLLSSSLSSSYHMTQAEMIMTARVFIFSNSCLFATDSVATIGKREVGSSSQRNNTENFRREIISEVGGNNIWGEII